MAGIFTLASNNRINTRNGFLKLNLPSRKTKQGQNCLSYIGPSIWNKIPDTIKKIKNLNTFKHKVKGHFLKEKEKSENNIYLF